MDLSRCLTNSLSGQTGRAEHVANVEDDLATIKPCRMSQATPSCGLALPS